MGIRARLLVSIMLLSLSGCADIGYYWHSASGHMALMNARVDIQTLLEDPATDDELRARLELVLKIREFARERLALPVGGSYRDYVELDRPWVSRNLFAAPEFSTQLHQWCYPVIGCASYRGYFDEARLQKYARQMQDDGLEIYLGQVPAYSTLGWFDDPVLSSFVYWPDYRLAGLLFHELTHQQLYIDDDTTFNESFASAVQQVGTELWLASRGQTEQLEGFRRWLDYRAEVIALIESTRDQLGELYALELDAPSMRLRKAERFDAARAEHARIAEKFEISGGFTRWFAGELNNARIGSVSTYNSRLPAFLAMIDVHRKDFTAFFDYAAKIGALEREARDRCLDAWARSDGPDENACPALE